MSDQPKDGGQAFPHGDPFHGGDTGMTLRDWFAGQALAGMMAHPEPIRMADVPSVASDAYALADAMLAARNAK